MAEVTGLRNNALPYPVYGVPFGVTFPILDADGDLVTGATGLDSERSLNGDTFADCTNEATEVATSSGIYYLLLTAAEMTADVVSIIVKTTSSGAKTTVLTLYPRKLVALRSGTAQGGAAGYITLDASAGARDDRWNGCLCVATIDTLVEARIIADYTGSSQQAAVTPSWNVAPDSDDTFIIYLPEGMQLPTVNVGHVNETAQTAADLAARLGTPAGASIAADLVTIAAYVDSLESRIPAALTGDGLIQADALRVGGTLQTAGDLAAQLATIAAYVDSLETRIPANLTEPTAAPPATPTPAEALAWLFLRARNKLTATATQEKVYADDGVTLIGTYALSDDGVTATRGEVA